MQVEGSSLFKCSFALIWPALTARYCIFCIISTGGSDTESDEDTDSHKGGVEVDSDDEDDVFFEARDTLRKSASSQIHPPDSPTHSEVDMDIVGFDYPQVARRKCLPEPKEKEKSVSLWSMIKDNIGKDLTKVCLPVYFNEPISSLQRCFEDVEYSYLLDRAAEYGKRVRFSYLIHPSFRVKWFPIFLSSIVKLLFTWFICSTPLSSSSNQLDSFVYAGK